VNSANLKEIWTHPLRTIIVFDFKGDYLDLPDKLGRDMWDLYSIQSGFKVGLNPPRLCEENNNWINQATKILSAETGIKHGEAGLNAVIRFLRERMNKRDKKKDNDLVLYPTPSNIRDLLKRANKKSFTGKDSFTETIIDRMDWLISNANNIFDVHRGFDICDLILPGRCAVIDAVGCDPFAASIIVGLILSQLHCLATTYRLTADFAVISIFLDEADFLCSREAGLRYRDGYNTEGMGAKIFREFGIELNFGVSFIGKCSPFISSNITKYNLGNQSDAESNLAAARTLMEPHAGQLLRSLGRGFFIQIDSLSRVSHGYLVKADYIPPNRELRPDNFDQHLFIEGRPLTEFKDVIDGVKERKKEDKKRELEKARNSNSDMNSDTRNLLDQCSLKPLIPTSKLDSDFNKFSFTKRKAMMSQLEKMKLAKFTLARTGRMNLFLPEITDEGWKYLGKTKPKGLGSGNIMHRFAINVIKKLGQKKGHKTFSEW